MEIYIQNYSNQGLLAKGYRQAGIDLNHEKIYQLRKHQCHLLVFKPVED